MQISIDTPLADDEISAPALPEPRHRECGSHAGLRWYCGQAKPGMMFTARDYLIRQEFEVVVPLMARRSPAGIMIRPLLGPYMLIRFDVSRPNWRRITSTPGMARLFGATPEAPSPICDADVDRLLALRCDTLGEPPTIGSGIAQGVPILCVQGPHRGHSGLCLDVVSATARCLLFTTAGPIDLDLPLRWLRRA